MSTTDILEMGDLASSPEYLSFRSNISLKTIYVDTKESWTLFDAGPRDIKCPLVFFPPASGQADIFFKQILALSGAGYRVISVQYPVYWSPIEFANGFRRLMDHLRLDKVHIFGASLGGFLAQKFAEHTRMAPRVQSLILCNSFIDTTAFNHSRTASTFYVWPSVLLKTMVMGTFEKVAVDQPTGESIDFMVKSLDSLSREELASRLTMNCTDNYIQPQRLRDIPVMIMDVNDHCCLSQEVKDELYKCYPDARKAQLKSGGNFPYLSRASEVNLFIQIHLSQFVNTRYSAMEGSGRLATLFREVEEASTSAIDQTAAPSTSGYAAVACTTSNV